MHEYIHACIHTVYKHAFIHRHVLMESCDSMIKTKGEKCSNFKLNGSVRIDTRTTLAIIIMHKYTSIHSYKYIFTSRGSMQFYFHTEPYKYSLKHKHIFTSPCGSIQFDYPTELYKYTFIHKHNFTFILWAREHGCLGIQLNDPWFECLKAWFVYTACAIYTLVTAYYSGSYAPPTGVGNFVIPARRGGVHQ